jgi:hypothetical protein
MRRIVGLDTPQRIHRFDLRKNSLKGEFHEAAEFVVENRFPR